MTTPTPAPNVITRRNAWQSAWQLAASDSLFALPLIGLAVLLAATAILPQTPRGDSTAYARWLSDTQLRFGGAADALAAIGLFDVLHSAVFRALVGLLGFVLIVRFIDRVRDFQAASRSGDPPVAGAPSVETSRSADLLLQSLRGYRTVKRDTVTIAQRMPIAYLGAIAVYVGGLVLLLGLMLSPLIDWRIEALSAMPGAATPIPNTPYTLRVSSITADGAVELALLQDGAPIAQGVAAPGRPLSGGGIGLFVRDILPALRASGRDENGRPLDLLTSADSAPSTDLLLTFDADHPDAFFVTPRAQFAVRVSLRGQVSDRAYQVTVFSNPDAAQIAEASLRPGDRLSANGSIFEFQNESHAFVDVAQAPSQAITLAGLLTALAGLALVVAYPPRRIWLVATERGTRVHCDDPDFDLERLTTARSQA